MTKLEVYTALVIRHETTMQGPAQCEPGPHMTWTTGTRLENGVPQT